MPLLRSSSSLDEQSPVIMLRDAREVSGLRFGFWASFSASCEESRLASSSVVFRKDCRSSIEFDRFFSSLLALKNYDTIKLVNKIIHLEKQDTKIKFSP